jgi:diguanylate cyclase (GGDEF)-like protein
MPITKSDHPLALIVVRKLEGVLDPLGLGLVGAMRSHIAMAFENAQLYNLATTDELTHLYTARYFRYCIEKKFSNYKMYGEKLTLLMLDLDDFKKINDTYGHLAGDSVLKEAAKRIMDSLRDSEDLAFRYGGEEFSVLLPSTDPRVGKLVAERIRENIADSVFETENDRLRMTVSIGASTLPDNALTLKDLIFSADAALYEAKRTGKNKVVVSKTRSRET